MAILVPRLIAVAERDALWGEEAAKEGAHRKDLVADELEESADLPLRHGAEAEARHVDEGAQVHRHDQVGARGVREDKARILRWDPRLHEIAVETERPLSRLFKSRAYCLIGFSDRARQHCGRLLEGDVALRLLIKRHAGAMAHQLVAERSGDTGDGEGEDDVLNGAPVARLNDAVHQLALFRRINLASNGAAVDLFWWKF